MFHVKHLLDPVGMPGASWMLTSSCFMTQAGCSRSRLQQDQLTFCDPIGTLRLRQHNSKERSRFYWTAATVIVLQSKLAARDPRSDAYEGMVGGDLKNLLDVSSFGWIRPAPCYAPIYRQDEATQFLPISAGRQGTDHGCQQSA
jgi:hypothetical protein